MVIKVLLNGAAGRMGRTMAASILNEKDMELVAAVDMQCGGQDIGMLAGCDPCGVLVQTDLATAIQTANADVMLEFTHAQSVMKSLRVALSLGLSCVVGTSGMSLEDQKEAGALAEEHDAALFIAPNFALSAVLMMRFAAQAVKYFPNYEIIELHHDKKIDAPSGTAMATAQMMSANRAPFVQGDLNSFEVIPGSRGGDFQGARIHSVRLPGILAMQEVLLGGPGQTLSIKQESISRDCYFPGVALALRKIHTIKGMVIGLENLLDD